MCISNLRVDLRDGGIEFFALCGCCNWRQIYYVTSLSLLSLREKRRNRLKFLIYSDFYVSAFDLQLQFIKCSSIIDLESLTIALRSGVNFLTAWNWRQRVLLKCRFVCKILAQKHNQLTVLFLQCWTCNAIGS